MNQSRSDTRIYCPLDTLEVLGGESIDRNGIDNFALRYQYFLSEKEAEKEAGKFEISTTSLPPHYRSLIENLLHRQTELVRQLSRNDHYQFYCGQGKVDWRMVVGLGGEHVQETNMTLDHVYGVPIIPGSAIKGIVRSWVIQNHFNGREELTLKSLEGLEDEELKNNINDFQQVFGTQGQSGGVRFLTAYPAQGQAKLELDIINSHFPDYYAGQDLPTDDQKTNPIKFLTIEESIYRFIILSKDKRQLQLAEDWMKSALTQQGIGAKTAIGYGYFQHLQNRKLERDFAPFETVARQIKAPLSSDDNLEALKNCLSQFAPVATSTEEFRTIEEIGGIEDIPEDWIEHDITHVMLSVLGEEIWTNYKDQALVSRRLNLPNLRYSSDVFSDLRQLKKEDRLTLQEALLKLAFDSEVTGQTYPTGDPNGKEIHFSIEHGIINLLGYSN